jgi:hypothetical protein
MMGVLSPYLTIAFPKHGPVYTEYFDLQTITPRARASWKKSFLTLMQRLSFRDRRRLVLKSPPHSCRIPTLLELFPDARFVHITRNPYVLFPSTMNLWKSLYAAHGLQKADQLPWLEEYVLATLPMLYDRIAADQKLIRPDRYHELRYEDLVKDPIGEMRKLYDQLGLGGFDTLQPKLEAYWSQNAEYQTNRYRLSDEQKETVRQRWGRIIDRYGYGEA